MDILDSIERCELRLSYYRLSTWRLMHIGARPVPLSLIKRWKEVFPEHEYDTNYGLSESIGQDCVHLGVEIYIMYELSARPDICGKQREPTKTAIPWKKAVWASLR